MRMNMLLTTAAALAVLLVQAGQNGTAAQTRTTLDIYVVDVEGGNATLLVAPSGESLLIDTGNVAPAAAIRDAERIAAAAKDARLTQIDNLIITHWHGDHYGGLAELTKRHCHVKRKIACQMSQAADVHAATVAWRHVSIA